MATVITLSEVPQSPHELEDYVAALFQAAGYFVEKNIIERDPADVLELDAVATRNDGIAPEAVLVEAKSKGWGYPDIFKIVGWMQYLNFKRSAFFVQNLGDKQLDTVQKRFSPLGLTFIHLDEFSKASGLFGVSGFPAVNDELLVRVWRFVYWMERVLIDQLRSMGKTEPSKAAPRTVLVHHRLVNDSLFFVEDFLERLSRLYSAYSDHPRLACGAAIEMAGGSFAPDVEDPTNPLIREAMYDCRHDLLQGCFYLEHRSRLAIIKTAIDHVLSMGSTYKTTLNGLPASFNKALDQLRRDSYFRQYALFWQVFLWGFGGFYLEDRKKEEFQWLASQTGVPVEHIPKALKVFDILLPMNGSWTTQSGASQCVVVKMVPCAFRGLGVYQRLKRYAYKTPNEFSYSDKTVHDLVRWNNAAVRLLSASLPTTKTPNPLAPS